jgi:hypothetical protein
LSQSDRRYARAIEDVKFLSFDGVDGVASRTLEFLTIGGVVQIQDSTASWAINDESWIRIRAEVLNQAEAKSLDETARFASCTSDRALDL